MVKSAATQSPHGRPSRLPRTVTDLDSMICLGNGLRMERPRSPCELRESLRQVGRAQSEERKPECQRKED